MQKLHLCKLQLLLHKHAYIFNIYLYAYTCERYINKFIKKKYKERHIEQKKTKERKKEEIMLATLYKFKEKNFYFFFYLNNFLFFKISYSCERREKICFFF